MRANKMHTVTILLISFAFVLNGCSSQAEEMKPEETVPVKMSDVVHKNLSLPIHTSGKLYASAEMKLSFKIPGIVKRIGHDEGQAVSKGQTLARLDETEIHAQVNQAQTAYNKAKRDLQRTQNLYADSVATLEQLQNAESAFHLAQDHLNIATFNLKHSKISAPANGKILKRLVETNEMVAAGQPVFVFGATGDAWIVRAGLTDKDVLRVQLGDFARVTFDAYPGKTFPATVSQIAEAANPRNGTFEVELQIQQQTLKLISGFVATIDIFPARKESFYLVPIESVLEADGNNGYIYTATPDESIAHKLAVTLGPVVGRDMAIRSDLSTITSVVTEGSPYLSDGTALKIIN